jgi:hypothetical protein
MSACRKKSVLSDKEGNKVVIIGPRNTTMINTALTSTVMQIMNLLRIDVVCGIFKIVLIERAFGSETLE